MMIAIDEQDVDEPAKRVGRHEAEQPQHQQDDNDGPEHVAISL
jgi:hypothetical protein